MRASRLSLVCAAIGASLAIAACATAPDIPSLPTSPAAVCDRTGWDESAGTFVELGYKLFRTAGELGVDAGVIKGARATKVRALDNRLFGLTQTVQNAYFACNAADYKTAIEKAKQALKEGDAALKGEAT